MRASDVLKKARSMRSWQGTLTVRLRIWHDSRRCHTGNSFLCAGEVRRTDGHRYIDDAVARGAACIVMTDDIGIPGAVSQTLGGYRWCTDRRPYDYRPV